MPRFGKKTLYPPVAEALYPTAALPGGDVEVRGYHLGPGIASVPSVLVGGLSAKVHMSRDSRICFRVPESASSRVKEGDAAMQVEIRNQDGASKPVPLRVARLLSDGLNPVTSPVVSRSGMTFATISGPRGKQTPVSIVRISPDCVGTPFLTGILNPTGLAFNPYGELFVTSRAEGNVYRIDAVGEPDLYAEGMGIATGAAFDREGNLFVGDRNGTIFKISAARAGEARKIFVYATLEPSPAAYHLAVGAEGTLFVTAPNISSNDCIWAIDRDGATSAWFRGLGRPQGLALDRDHNVYVAATWQGRRGIVRITPQGKAELAVAGYNLVGIAFSPLGTAVLATNDALYDVPLGVEGLKLF